MKRKNYIKFTIIFEKGKKTLKDENENESSDTYKHASIGQNSPVV